MYKVIIVDDEKMIRMGMKRAVRWNAVGIGEVYTAANGKEAVEILNRQKPEIMITDINMAEMSGLDLIATARQISPGLRIIVLTGYDKFEYAQQCLRMNVQDFLLKPIDKEVLTETLKKQVEALDSQKESEVRDPNFLRVREVAKQMELETKMRDLAHGRIFPDSVFTEGFYRDFPYKKDQKIQVTVIVPPGLLYRVHDEEIYIAQTIKNICTSLVDFEGEGITFLDDDGKTVILYFNRDSSAETMENVRRLTGILKDECGTALKTAIGNPVSGLQYMAVSYNDAVALLQKQENDFQEILLGSTAQKKTKLFEGTFAEMKTAMCESMGNTDYVLRIFEHFCTAASSYNISNSDTRQCCYEIASSVYYNYINDTGSQTDDRLISYMKVLRDSDKEQACEVTRIFLRKLLDENDQKDVHEILSKSKRYIAEHLSEDLSVAHIAAELYLTPNYFSRLFKRVAGEGCNEYIVRKRIEKAKILLQTTNLKASKIADMVGYRDTNYFSLAFKKNTGVSPTKYREQFRQLG